MVERQSRARERVRPALGDSGRAAGFGDHDQALLACGHVVVEAIDGQAVVERVVGDHQVVGRAADAFELARHDVGGHVAGDVDAVRTQAANHAVGHAEGGGLDEELVIAFEAIDLDHFDRGVAHVQAGAEDALFGDRDVIGELCRQHHQLVEAGAAIDRDRRVDVVLHLVFPAAGADV